MVHQDSILDWLELDTMIIKEEESISKLFDYNSSNFETTKYSVVKIHSNTIRANLIDLSHIDEIVSMIKSNDISEWFKITTKRGRFIIAEPDAVIMVYDNSNSYKELNKLNELNEKGGYNYKSASRYIYQSKKFRHLKIGDFVRIIYNWYGDDVWNSDFDYITSIEHMVMNPSPSYHIMTKLGFYKCNGIYLSSKS